MHDEVLQPSSKQLGQAREPPNTHRYMKQTRELDSCILEVKKKKEKKEKNKKKAATMTMMFSVLKRREYKASAHVCSLAHKCRTRTNVRNALKSFQCSLSCLQIKKVGAEDILTCTWSACTSCNEEGISAADSGLHNLTPLGKYSVQVMQMSCFSINSYHRRFACPRIFIGFDESRQSSTTAFSSA
jgi:hypothetical protein